MFYSPIDASGTRKISTQRVRTMPTPMVSRSVVSQPVNLKPMGNTISLSVPAEMPFLSNRVTVVTQASGGMAKADPQMRSRSIRAMGFSGFGDISPADEAYGAFNKMDPSAASMNREQYDASPKRTYWEGEVAKWHAAPAAAPASAGPSGWANASSIFSTTVNAGANVYGQMQQAKIAQAKADQAKSESQGQMFMSRMFSPTQTFQAMSRRKSIAVPLLIVAAGAIAVAVFLSMRKKSAAPAAA